MSLNADTPEIEDVYFEEGFLIFMESFMTYLRTQKEVRMRDVTKALTIKYEGDFFGLLNELAVDKKFHLIVLMFNGYTASSDYDGTVEYLLTPDFAEVELLKNLYLTKP